VWQPAQDREQAPAGRSHPRAGQRQRDRGGEVQLLLATHARAHTPADESLTLRLPGPQHGTCIRLGLGAVGHQLDRQRQAVEPRQQPRQLGVAAVALALQPGRIQEQRARRLLGQGLDQERPPSGSAGQLEAAQRGRQAHPGQLGEVSERLLDRGRARGQVRLPGRLGVVEHQQGRRRAQSSGGSGGRVWPRLQPQLAGEGGPETSLVAHVLEPDEQAAVAEAGGRAPVVQGGDGELALADPAGAEHRDRARDIILDPGEQLLEIGLPPDEPAARGDAPCRRALAGGSLGGGLRRWWPACLDQAPDRGGDPRDSGRFGFGHSLSGLRSLASSCGSTWCAASGSASRSTQSQ
jgi:hypothetical protein